MAITTPKGEQIQFVSAKTGTHSLDTYLEAAEVGNRQLHDLLDDLFDSSTGVFKADNFQFRFDTSADKLQVRIGQYSSSTAGWADVTTFFKVTGTFSTSTSYNNFDLVTLSTKDIYIVHGLTTATAYSSESNFISSANTEKFVDVQGAQDWAIKTDGQVQSTDYSSKAWAIGGTGVTDTASKGAAKEWATKTSGTVDGSDHSAKHWATTGNVAAVSGAISNINTVAGISANITTVAGISSDVSTVAGVASNVTTVAGISSNVTTVAVDTTNIGTLASNLSGTDTIGTVAGAISNVNTVSGSISNVNTVATNISSVNDFAAKYRIGSSDPSSSNDEGDLFYNTTANALKVYTGSAWENGVSAGSGFLPISGGQLTGNITMSGSQTVDGRDLSADGLKLDAINLYVANESSPSAQPSATGANAVAIGDGAQATGSDSFALGKNSRSGATRSTAFAFSNAGGINSFAACIGSTSTSSGALTNNSVAMGKNATAGGLRSAALGDEAVTGTSGESAVALGTSYANGVDSFAAAIGITSTSLGARDANTIAIGLQANASETGAIALGRGTVAGDYYSSGLGGFNNLVNSDYATIAGGRENTIQDASSIQRGDYSAVLGGRDNTITNNYAAAWGRENTITGYGGTAGGTYNNISGAQSFAIGYFNITGSEAYYGFAHGAYAKATTEGSRAQASGRFTTTGDAQGGQYILRVATTNATPAVLITDPAYPATANTLVSAASDTCITFSGTIVAMQNGAQSYGSWEFKGLLVNDGGTTTLANSVITAISNTSNWGVALSANNTLNALSITVTGEASHNIRWVANIHTAEVTYA